MKGIDSAPTKTKTHFTDLQSTFPFRWNLVLSLGASALLLGLLMISDGPSLKPLHSRINVPALYFSITGPALRLPGNGAVAIGEENGPQGCICPVEMNMLYIGIPNPLNIAIPGVADSRVEVTMNESNGTIEKKNGRYYANVKRTGSTVITARYRSGSGWHEYNMSFRVRNLPKPEAKWGNIRNNGLPTPRAVIAAQTRVYASMGESFAFESVRFTVTRFNVILVPRRGDPFVQRVSGNLIPVNIRTAIMSASSGDRLIVDNIRANGPTGERPLSPILLELQ